MLRVVDGWSSATVADADWVGNAGFDTMRGLVAVGIGCTITTGGLDRGATPSQDRITTAAAIAASRPRPA